MKKQIGTFINVMAEETFTTYNYKEELELMLDDYSMRIGNNKRNGVEFELIDNGGEVSIIVPNIENFYCNIAFDINIEKTEIEYMEYACIEIRNLISRLDNLSEILKTIRKDIEQC